MTKLLLLALLAAIIVVGGYMVLGGFGSPAAAPAAANSASSDSSAVAFATPVLANPTIEPAQLNKDGIPTKIGTLTLNGSQTGTDVMAEFEQMHGKSFDLKSGFRGDYVDGTSKATLWVGQAQSADAATQLTKDMADKIGSSTNGMFSNMSSLNISGRDIYEAQGLGQEHFFYAVADKIVWLAADPDHAPDALHSIWGAIK